MLTTITRSQMEQDIADDLRWILENDPNLEAAWEAVVEDSTPETEVLAYDLGNSNYVHVMLAQEFALATFGQSEPRSIDDWFPPAPGLCLYEDGGGAIALYGATWDGQPINYRDLAYSTTPGAEEIVIAYHEGIDGWEHGQDNDEPICNAPEGQLIAEYDGETLTMHVNRMGAAGRIYLLGEGGANALR